MSSCAEATDTQHTSLSLYAKLSCASNTHQAHECTGRPLHERQMAEGKASCTERVGRHQGDREGCPSCCSSSCLVIAAPSPPSAVAPESKSGLLAVVVSEHPGLVWSCRSKAASPTKVGLWLVLSGTDPSQDIAPLRASHPLPTHHPPITCRRQSENAMTWIRRCSKPFCQRPSTGRGGETKPCATPP